MVLEGAIHARGNLTSHGFRTALPAVRKKSRRNSIIRTANIANSITGFLFIACLQGSVSYKGDSIAENLIVIPLRNPSLYSFAYIRSDKEYSRDYLPKHADNHTSDFHQFSEGYT